MHDGIEKAVIIFNIKYLRKLLDIFFNIWYHRLDLRQSYARERLFINFYWVQRLIYALYECRSNTMEVSHGKYH